MDLQAASKLTGLSSRIAKMGALLCFVLACGILIASLARASILETSSPETAPSLHIRVSAAR